MSGAYGLQNVQTIEKFVQNHLPSEELPFKGSRVLVVGSQSPWLEALLLENGAGHVTTLDYVKINCDHPNITTITPDELRQAYLNNKFKEFDFVVSFSSIEHSGLGRYGDGLNPWGDLIASAKAGISRVVEFASYKNEMS